MDAFEFAGKMTHQEDVPGALLRGDAVAIVGDDGGSLRGDVELRGRRGVCEGGGWVSLAAAGHGAAGWR